jgi:DNA transformation protein
MAVSQGFLDYVLEQLARVTRVTHKRMFGGVGLYADGIFFAIIADDELYFKVDDSTRSIFESRGMEPFRPYGDDRSMNYYQVPADVLEDVDLLRDWANRAVEVALATKRGFPQKGKR